MYKLLCNEADINYGQKFLLELCDKRQLNSWWRENGYEGVSSNFVFKLAVGANAHPSIEFIWKMRRKINPILWFYKITEPLPELVPEEEMIDDIYEYEKMKNYQFLKKQESLKTWCIQNKVHYPAIWQIITKGKCITFSRIVELKQILEVKNWFVEGNAN